MSLFVSVENFYLTALFSMANVSEVLYDDFKEIIVDLSLGQKQCVRNCAIFIQVTSVLNFVTLKLQQEWWGVVRVR